MTSFTTRLLIHFLKLDIHFLSIPQSIHHKKQKNKKRNYKRMPGFPPIFCMNMVANDCVTVLLYFISTKINKSLMTK